MDIRIQIGNRSAAKGGRGAPNPMGNIWKCWNLRIDISIPKWEHPTFSHFLAQKSFFLKLLSRVLINSRGPGKFAKKIINAKWACSKFVASVDFLFPCKLAKTFRKRMPRSAQFPFHNRKDTTCTWSCPTKESIRAYIYFWLRILICSWYVFKMYSNIVIDI